MAGVIAVGAQSGVEPEDARSLPWDSLPTWTFGFAVTLALPYLMYEGRNQWFHVDDFDFFANRRLSSFSELMQSHFGHWSTLPIIEYRVLYGLVGLNHYWPYFLIVVAAHITATVLLYILMRRALVHPWIATTAGVIFLYLGAGSVDIFWSFQIGFTGALAVGLGSVLLVDHEGTDRRDAFGFACALAALLCSGVGVAMVAAAGVTIFIRRGWRASLIFTAPLAVVFAVWSGAYGQSPPAPLARTWTFLWVLASNPFGQLSYVYAFGWVLGALLVGGTAMIIASKVDLRRYSATAGLLAGFAVFVVTTSLARGFQDASQARLSRYLYIGVALILPAIAAGASAVARNKPWAVIVAVGIMLIGLPGNFLEMHPTSAIAGSPSSVMAVADSPLLDHDPASYVVALPTTGFYVTVGWLRDARKAGKLPLTEPTTEAERATAAFHLSFAVVAKPGASCRPVATDLTLQAGEVLELPVGETTVTLRNDGIPVVQVPYRATGYFYDQFLRVVIPVSIRVDRTAYVCAA